MRVRMSTNGINNNGNNSNGSSMEDMSGMMTCSSSSPSPTDIRIERETASSFACGVSSVSSMSAEYTFSSAFRFGSKVWKLGAKRLKDVYSFLIYPMDVDDTSHEEGYSVQMVIVSPDESEDHILVQGRREFNNNATIFVWTASFTSLRPFLQHDTIFISFDMKTLSPGHIFSTDAELDFRDNIRQSAKDQVMDKATGVFPIILTGIRDISLNGISSPSFAFEGNQWELKMCQNGNLYAFRIMCNRKIGQRFSVCAKIQLSVHASPVPAAVTTAATGNTGSSEPVAGTGFRTIHVEGSRRFRDSDDSMFWSFDKRLDKYVNDDALAVEMKITVYRPRDKNDLPASQKQESAAEVKPAQEEPATPPAPVVHDVHVKPDLTLLVGRNETPVPVHRQLLMQHSPWITTLSKKVKGLARVRVTDCDLPEVMTLLKFIYMGKLDINEENFAANLKAAKRFEMKEIFSACSGLISVHNVLMFVNMTDDSVSTAVWNMVDQQAAQVLKSSLFLELSSSSVIDIIQRDDLQATEMQIYEACINWATAEVRRQKLVPTGNSIRKVLDKILYHVRFPLMDPVVLALITDEQSRDYYKVLSDKEALGIFRAIHTKDPKATIFSLKPRNHAPAPVNPEQPSN